MNSRKQNPALGVVIPCYNEEAVLPALLAALNVFARTIPGGVSILFVNDGSGDRTTEMLEAACARDERMACLHLSRNFGHQTAVSAGLNHIRGDVIAVLDADLQDPPEVVIAMIEKWREGFDVVYGVRQNRKEGVLLRAAYAAFYRLLKRVSNIEIPLDAGDFCLMDRKVVDLVNSMPEHNRFVRGLRGWVGFKQTGLPYERAARAAGETKYNIGRLFKLAFDGLVSFSAAPLRLASIIGVLSATSGLLYLLYVLFAKLTGVEAPPGWASIVAAVTFFGGVQLLVLGIIGEYIGRIFEEAKRRPLYVIGALNGWVADSTQPPR